MGRRIRVAPVAQGDGPASQLAALGTFVAYEEE
jgi:hypothetical protein